jgi:hypothetical protein
MNTLPNLRLYALALRLYPAAFRARYADEMLATGRHEYARSPNPLRFTISLAADTLRGALREHLRAAAPTRPGYVAAFALFFSFLVLTVSVVHQQILRRAADKQPSVVATIVSTPGLTAQFEATRLHIVDGIMAPEPELEISSPKFLNRADHPLTFAIFYDESAHAIGGNAVLHGALPQPPIGIFNEIRAHDNDEVTWRPEPGVRIALSGRPMPNGGFVVTGQSLAPSEARTARLNSILRWMWAFAMFACLALVLVTPTRKPTT